MKCNKIFMFLIMMVISFQSLFSQTTSKPVYVIVHGAWGGGWAYQKVDSLLTKTGSIVYRPTLTGQGERVHLATKDVGLATHIKDIVNTILFENLTNVILIGHSYGGMVVTGVADRIPERIQKLIYIDAFVPEDNESVISISGRNEIGFEIANGYIIPPWVEKGKTPPKDVPHPLKTWKDTISLKNPKRLQIHTTFILTVEKGKDPKKDDFYAQSQRAKNKNWQILQLASNHNAQWSVPEELVNMLKDIESR